MATKKNMTIKDETGFEKARYEYCAKIFEKEKNRKEILENKAQFYLSFITIFAGFVGAIFLNVDFLNYLENALNHKLGSIIVLGMFVSSTTMVISILTSFFAIIKTVSLQKYKNEHPNNVVYALFSPETIYLESMDEASIFRAAALGYVIALTHNMKINDKKTKWIKVSSFAVFATCVSLFLFIALVLYITLT